MVYTHSSCVVLLDPAHTDLRKLTRCVLTLLVLFCYTVCTHSSGVVLLEPAHTDLRKLTQCVLTLLVLFCWSQHTLTYQNSHSVYSLFRNLKKTHVVCTHSVSGIILLDKLRFPTAAACTFWIQVYQHDYVGSSGFRIGQLGYLLSCWHYGCAHRVGIYE